MVAVLIMVRDCLVALALAWVGVSFEPANEHAKASSGACAEEASCRN